MASSRLTVYFEDPFWVGLYEREDGGRYEVSRIVFGAEPKDYEVWEYVLRSYSGLKFSPAVEAARKRAAGDPKRRRREAERLMRGAGIGTKSQQALAAAREVSSFTSAAASAHTPAAAITDRPPVVVEAEDAS
mgnify:CR=1 FL=1